LARSDYYRGSIGSTTEEQRRAVSNPFGEITHEIKTNPWKLGVIYVDAADNRLIVRQRSGLGWTLNFGRPLSWVILAAFLGIVLVGRRTRVDK
jgi:uncharacterized membrane protein